MQNTPAYCILPHMRVPEWNILISEKLKSWIYGRFIQTDRNDTYHLHDDGVLYSGVLMYCAHMNHRQIENFDMLFY